VLRFSEHVYFLNKTSIVRGLREVPAGAKVTVDGSGSAAIDTDVLEVLRDFQVRATEDDIDLELHGIEGLDAMPPPVGH
jgi:MFS superfamily sulfate permease-like transporter